MKKDYDLIVHKFSKDMPYLNLYPIGDMQVGSANFDEEGWHKWKKEVLADDKGYVVIVGDTINNGLKRSKSNVYDEVMRPREQKEWLVRELGSIGDKILGVVRGNHEERSSNETDNCPLYDVMAKLDLESLYRENMAFLKINLGSRTADRQCSYVIGLAHGKSKARTGYFAYMIDGMDVFVTGHIHTPSSTFPAKIVIDSHNETIRRVGFKHIIVPSLDYGGYQLRDMYNIQDSNVFPIVHLGGERKEVSVTWK